jgi:hypothetical protein
MILFVHILFNQTPNNALQRTAAALMFNFESMRISILTRAFANLGSR